MGKVYKSLKKCRICGSKDLYKYLDLGKTPLANHLIDIKNADKKEDTFPLEVLYCKNCSLSQLSIVVEPEVLFSYYPYRSSVSKSFRKHCAGMAAKAAKILGANEKNENNLVVDIASNDGCLLQEFKKKNFRTIGVEPAKNLAKIAESNGIETINRFWSRKAAKSISAKHGKAKIIAATNVFAHADNLNEFMEGVEILLDNSGFFIVEVPYFHDLMTNNEFDTVYHEHLSYFLVRPLHKLYSNHNLSIVKIEKYPIHGGTIRVYASKSPKANLNISKSVEKFLDFEEKEGMYKLKSYDKLGSMAQKIKKELLAALKKLKEEGKKTAAYGASAKGNTLLNYCGIDSKLVEFIVDDTPEKQNHLAPGSRIKIVDAGFLEKEKPDYLLLLAWNFAKEIMQKTRMHYKRKVRYIIPIPRVRIL